jgi:glutathione S-transferase
MAAARLKLIGSFASPYTRKARIVAAEKRIEYTWESQSPWPADTTVPDWNPLGKVPVLVLDDGTALYDSRVICEFLDSASPLGRLIPADGRERIEVRRWEALADGVLDAGVLWRLENTRPLGERSPSWIERQKVKVERGLNAVEHQLGSRAFCTGPGFTLADIAVGCCLGWLDFRFPQLDWRADRPNLARLAAKLFERPSFAETVPRE